MVQSTSRYKDININDKHTYITNKSALPLVSFHKEAQLYYHITSVQKLSISVAGIQSDIIIIEQIFHKLSK